MRGREPAWNEVVRQAPQRALAAQPPPLSAWAAEKLTEALLALGPDSRLNALANGDPRLRNPRLASHLLRESAAARLSHPKRAAKLAVIAVELAEALGPEDGAAGILASLRAEAWAARGNTQRILGEYEGAERSFSRAEEKLAATGPDPALEAEFLRFKARLRRAQRRFSEALDLAERSATLAERSHDAHAAGLARLEAGGILYALDRSADAARLAEAAGSQLDARADPLAGLLVVQNLALALAGSQQPELALGLLTRTRNLSRWAPPAVRLSATWLRGRLHGAQGHLRQAVRALEHVRRVCRENGNDYDLALATIDLCLVWARHQRTAEVNVLAKELAPLAESPRIPEVPREMIAEFAAQAGLWKLEPAVIEETLAALRDRRAKRGPAASDPG